jgi:hypothetical protein
LRPPSHCIRNQRPGTHDCVNLFTNAVDRRSSRQGGRKNELMENFRKYVIIHHIAEPYRPKHKYAVKVIRRVRKKWLRVMVKRTSLSDCGIMDYNGCVTFKSGRQTVRGDLKGDVHWNGSPVRQSTYRNVSTSAGVMTGGFGTVKTLD